MRRNTHLIDQSEILATIIEKIEISYPEDISLLICYGSYVTGDYGLMSDIDFFFVPKTEKGYTLGEQFILDDIGYDSWPVSWERLIRISQLEEHITSILMDGKVLFASSEDELHKFDELKKNVVQRLHNKTTIRDRSKRSIEKAKVLYFALQNDENDIMFIHAMNIMETLLFALALINGTYTHKGVKRIDHELKRFSLLPERFLERYQRLIRTHDASVRQNILRELIHETETLWNTHFGSGKEAPDVSELKGFYEEFKSTYNKLLCACDEKNYEQAYYAGYMIDQETQEFLVKYSKPGTFPDMMNTIIRNDFEIVRVKCLDHERQLLNLLNQHGIKINTYRNIHEFRQSFLEKT
jgi:predicted nucleotidyltransferase